MSTLADVTKQALDLTVEERIILVQRLWDNIGYFVSTEVEKAWLDEVDQRWQEIEEGKVECLPADQVMKQVRESLNRQYWIITRKHPLN